MSMIPPTPHPWRIVEAEGERFMVKEHDGVVWICRLPDRELWLLDVKNAPAWARKGEYSEQRPLF